MTTARAYAATSHHTNKHINCPKDSQMGICGEGLVRSHLHNPFLSSGPPLPGAGKCSFYCLATRLGLSLLKYECFFGWSTREPAALWREKN